MKYWTRLDLFKNVQKIAIIIIIKCVKCQRVGSSLFVCLYVDDVKSLGSLMSLFDEIISKGYFVKSRTW